MDLVEANGLKVFLATSTAAHPAWMAKRHPDILRTEFSGMKRNLEAPQFLPEQSNLSEVFCSSGEKAGRAVWRTGVRDWLAHLQ